jgi:hypothetical protein
MHLPSLNTSVERKEREGVELAKHGGSQQHPALVAHPPAAVGSREQREEGEEGEYAADKAYAAEVEAAEEMEERVCRPLPLTTLRGSRCVDPEDSAAAAARRDAMQWEPEQAVAFCDTAGAATSVRSRSSGDLKLPLHRE